MKEPGILKRYYEAESPNIQRICVRFVTWLNILNGI